MQQRVVCLSDDSPIARKDRLKEATAQLEIDCKGGGEIPNLESQTHADNAMLRCAALPATDQLGCELLVKGRGVKGGDGIQRVSAGLSLRT